MINCDSPLKISELLNNDCDYETLDEANRYIVFKWYNDKEGVNYVY